MSVLFCTQDTHQIKCESAHEAFAFSTYLTSEGLGNSVRSRQSFHCSHL